MNVNYLLIFRLITKVEIDLVVVKYTIVMLYSSVA